MLKGNFRHTIDKKGRIIVPSKLKRAISEAAEVAVIMLPGKNHCIELYPKDVWSKIEENIARLNSNDPEVLKVIRFYAHNAHEEVLDSQGRILIPAHLREYARIELEKEIIITGTVRYIEVWNPEAMAKVAGNDRDEIDTITARLPQWNY